MDRDDIKTEGQNLEVGCVRVYVCVWVREENPQGGGFMFSFSSETGWFGCYLWKGGFIIGSQCLPFMVLIRECKSSSSERICLKLMLKFCLSEGQDQANSCGLAGQAADGLCLPQLPPHTDRPTLPWCLVPLHLLPIQHKGTSSQSPTPFPGLCSVFNSY